MPKLLSQNSKRIMKYSNIARNIREIPDLYRAYTSMHFGSKEIFRALMQLPETAHDMVTFSTDCITYNDTMIVITVNGVYMDQAPSIMESDILMGFSRTFILKPIQHKTVSRYFCKMKTYF